MDRPLGGRLLDHVIEFTPLLKHEAEEPLHEGAVICAWGELSNVAFKNLRDFLNLSFFKVPFEKRLKDD